MKLTKTLTMAASLSLLATSAFAAAVTITDTGTTTVGTPAASIKPSKNVTVYYEGLVATGGATNVSYSISASHSSGTKSFGSSSGDTKIFMKDGTSYNSITPPAAGASADFGGWTAM